MRTSYFLPLLGLLATTALHANNIQVANTTLVDNTGTTVKVQFDISWENSWRGGGVNNWDAAWVFVKYRQGQGSWQHVHMNLAGHTAPAGSMLETGLVDPASPYNATTNPVVGLFLRRNADGNGTFSASGVQLLWDYGGLGVAYNDISQVQVFAIEMVYVNEGSFRLGSGGSEPAHFNISGPGNNAYVVNSENAINTGSTAPIGQFYLWADDQIEAGTVPAAFPKGFAASYVMKYEISSQQYVDFLNSLSRTQQNSRTETDLSVGITNVSPRFVMVLWNTLPSFTRTAVACNATVSSAGQIRFYCDLNEDGVEGGTNDGQWIACGNLNWGDVAAYLDWSGLRPMSEMEFEKMCRGPLPPVPNEGAWGTAEVAASVYTLSAPGTAQESVVTGYSTTAGNCVYRGTDGSFQGMGGTIGFHHTRVGLFAGHPFNIGRVTAGASYYGIMELTGNVDEFAVAIDYPEGRNYQAKHGDGSLNTSGQHDVLSWPTTATGVHMRGQSGFTYPKVSERSPLGGAGRNYNRGGRGVRSAP